MRVSIIIALCFVYTVTNAQNVGIGTSDPQDLLHLNSADPTAIKLQSKDTVGIKIVPGADMPFHQSIYRNGRFDQGIIWTPIKTEIHTGRGKISDGTYFPLPSLTLDNKGNVGVNMGSEIPTQAIDVNGKIKIGNDDNSDEQGSIKWDGEKFMGYDGSGWKSFTDMNDADNDSKIYLEEDDVDEVIIQANGENNRLIYDGKRLSFSSENIYVGENAGNDMSTGDRNTFIGEHTGELITTGSRNTLVGARAAELQTNGSNNTFIGYSTGLLNNGSNNVFIGNEAGASASGSNKLYISNSSTNSPLIYGDFESKTLTINDHLDVNGDLSINGNGSAISFEVDGESKYEIEYQSVGDQLVIKKGNTAILTLKDDDVYLNQLVGMGERSLAIKSDGKIVTESAEQTFNSFDFGRCSDDGNFTYCSTGIHFKQGQVLNELDGIIFDNASSELATITLYRREKFMNVADPIFELKSTSQNSGYEFYSDDTVNTPGSNIVDNDTYIYYLSVISYSNYPESTFVREVTIR